MQRLSTDDGARAIVGAILAMCRQLELAVTAEGVEHEAEYRLLRQQGWMLMQGYLFGRPMPASAVPTYLAAARRTASDA